MSEREYAKVHLVSEDGTDTHQLKPGQMMIVNVSQFCFECPHCLEKPGISADELRERYAPKGWDGDE